MTRRATPVPVTHDPCRKCGKVHDRCAGHRNGDGGPCRQWPVHGTTVCVTHGASAPQVKRAAARREVLSRAERAVLALDPTARSGDWIDALERVLARQEAMEDYLRQRVEEVAPDDWRQLDAKDAEQLHALVDAYRVALRDLRDTADKIGRLDLDSVRLRLEGARVAAYAALMVKGADAYRVAAGVDGPAHEAGLAAMAKAMRT